MFIYIYICMYIYIYIYIYIYNPPFVSSRQRPDPCNPPPSDLSEVSTRLKQDKHILT